jgi:hypothetical protein
MSDKTSGLPKSSSTVQVQARYIGEAPLYFSKGTQDIDPKRGLEINGPSDKIADNVQTIRIGVISTAEGIQGVLDWCNFVNSHSIKSSVEQAFTSQTFPGFTKVFNARLVVSEDYNERISTREAELLLQTTNPNLRIRRAADLYASKVENICRRVTVPDVIICHESQEIERNCGLGVAPQKREQGELRKEERKLASDIREKVETHDILAPLDADTLDLLDMAVNQDFRKDLKARCLEFDTPTQILTQSALATMVEATPPAGPRGRQDPASVAWNLCVALYYKANHFPWRVGNLSKDTCYVGVSFYYDQTTSERSMFASLAQVFTDTGEGLVVRGDSFKWDVEIQGSPHLSKESANDLLLKAIGVYKKHHNDQPPNRIVVHKSSMYTDEERNGFKSACGDVPNYDFLSLGDGGDILFFRYGEKPVVRGTLVQLARASALIYTNGYVPYLRQYKGPRVPRPLEITQHFGDSTTDELARELIALTRLNWNTADYSCSMPITLEFARRVGGILGKVPKGAKVQEQYRYYM